MNSTIQRIGIAAGATALATAGLAVAPTGAFAADQPTAAYAGHLVAGPGAATLKIAYTCSSTESPASHLFVAVKQGPAVDPGAGSHSGSAVTYYSTNWKSDAGPNALRCDGVPHTQTIVLKPDADFNPAAPPLSSGRALVQICVFDNLTAPPGPNTEPSGGFAFDYTMQDVHAGNGVS